MEKCGYEKTIINLLSNRMKYDEDNITQTDWFRRVTSSDNLIEAWKVGVWRWGGVKKFQAKFSDLVGISVYCIV